MNEIEIKYLITPSLLGSFSWYLSDESEEAMIPNVLELTNISNSRNDKKIFEN